MTGRPVRKDLAMTGEITLRGRVLPIGGVKEKVLAAYRSGLRDVMLPASNEKDLREIPAAVRGQMRVHFVRTMDDVLDQLLLDAPLVTLADAAPTDQPPVSTTALSDRPARPRRPEPDRQDLEESR